MPARLPPLTFRVLAYLQMRGLTVVRTGDLCRPLGLSPRQEIKLISRMAGAGTVARVKRGVYVAPPRLPVGGTWSPDETLALGTLMAATKARYQICGPNAFNRYGWDVQVPARIYVYNNRLSGDRRIGAVNLSFIKVASARLGGTQEFPAADGRMAVYSSRSRALVDAVYDWWRFDSLPRAYDWIGRELAAGLVSASELVPLTLRYGNQATIRRMGACLEQENVSERLLARLERRLGRTTGTIPFLPKRPKRGRVIRRWGVVLNA